MRNYFENGILGRMLCMAFEDDMAAQEAGDGKVEAAAVTRAKEKMAQEKLENDAYEVQRRLENAERKEASAIKEGRYASKKKNILKTYSEKLKAAKAAFEASGDYKTYDKTINELENEKSKAIESAKEEVYGDDAWRIRD